MGRYQPPVTAEQRADRAQALEALHGRLRDQVRGLRTSEGWQAWLRTAARLPAYSARNQLLIAAQNPQATAVAGYTTWHSLGRQVEKGSRGLQILAPVVRRASTGDRTADAADTDGTGDSPTASTATGAPAGTAASAPASSTATSAGRPRLAGFRIAHVFDVAQTSGTPLPELPQPVLLGGAAPAGLWDGLAAQIAARGYSLSRDHTGEGNGCTDFAARTVTVRADLGGAQAAKTLAHELAHVLLHDPDQHPPAGLTRSRAEVEAESVAHLVAAACGLASEDYTVPYVTGWAGHHGDSRGGDVADAVLLATAERVLATAHTVLAALEPAGTGTSTTSRELAARLGQGTARTAAVRAAAEQAASASATPSARTRTATPLAPAHRQTLPDGAPPAREALLAACADAADLYAAHLAGPSAEGRAARAALTGRGVPDEQAARHRLGVSPLGWTATVDRLREAGHTEEVLLAAGLAAVGRHGGLLDRLRGRLVFPVADHDGAVVGFLGRDLGLTGPAAPKYLNTATTALYRKGEVLHGLAAARPALAAGVTPVLAEGPFDLLAVERAHPRWAPVAAIGTAVTAAHAAALAQALPLRDGPAEVVVALDGDPAGQSAALRAYPLLRAAGLWPLHAQLPGGQDPGALQPEELHSSLSTAGPLADAVLDAAVERWQDRLQWAEGRVGAARAGARVVVELPPAHAPRQLARLGAHLGDTQLAARAALEVLDRLGPLTAESKRPTPRPSGGRDATTGAMAASTCATHR